MGIMLSNGSKVRSQKSEVGSQESEAGKFQLTERKVAAEDWRFSPTDRIKSNKFRTISCSEGQNTRTGPGKG